MTSSAISSQAFAASRPRIDRGVLVGRILSGLMAALLTADGLAKVMEVQAVIDGSAQLGYPAETMQGIGFTLLACVILYVIPRTAFFGALLLTGYLGGAIATHVRVENPLFSHILFPTYVAAILWTGLYLRDARLRAFVSGRR
jgi:hypothetical protein